VAPDLALHVEIYATLSEQYGSYLEDGVLELAFLLEWVFVIHFVRSP
jgi:hypothetical protein